MPRFTPLQQFRQNYQPPLPALLQDIRKLKTERLGKSKKSPPSELRTLFPKTLNQPLLTFTIDQEGRRKPLRVGAVLSGGQAAGGHNVIGGMFDALKSLNPQSQLFGFLNGPDGIIKGESIELTETILRTYRNQGGFDLIGSGRGKIETPEQFKQAAEVVRKLNLDGVVIIGGDDSNTNAALLAEYFLTVGLETRVAGVPKTIDGDLKNEMIEISFGFDTAAKTFSEIIGNIARDCLSQKKYYFFIKLMGRSASHLTLECALQTHPNLALIGEEILEAGTTLKEITDQICDLICQRAEQGKNYGVILIPEGIIEFISEFRQLIQEIGGIKIEAKSNPEDQIAELEKRLTAQSKTCLNSLPKEIKTQLLLDRDPHGNLKVSQIETERLLIDAVQEELQKRKEKGRYAGKFDAQPHFCGYEGRSCLPSNFDCQYCYALGHVAVLLIDCGETGYMSCVQNLSHPVEYWQIAGIPLTSLIHLEERKGKQKPVIRKALVDLNGGPFQIFKEQRTQWIFQDDYRYPGPIQFFGPPEITESITLTLEYESQKLAMK